MNNFPFIGYLTPYFKHHTMLAAALIAGFIGAIILSPPSFLKLSPQGALFYLAATGGGAISGYRLVRYIYKRKYEIVDFHKWTIDKKRNYLMSLVNK